MHKILTIRLYFPLDALRVSEYISPSSEATFISCTSHLVYAGICRYVWLLCGYSHITARPMVPSYTKCDVQLINVVPEDGLIKSETCRGSNRKLSLITRILCILLVYIHVKFSCWLPGQ